MSSFSKSLKSIKDTADEYNWSPKRVRALIDEGLPFVRIGRQMLINDQTLDQYLQEREASGGCK